MLVLSSVVSKARSMWKWTTVTVCVWVLASGVSASRPEHRTRDLIRPNRELVRPDRIVGGEPVSRGDMPWQVSIQLKYGSIGKHFCGGTLVGDSWVLTAAHCTRGIDYDDVVVVTGAWDLKEKNSEYKVSQVFSAPYNPLTLQHDVALLKIDIEKPVSNVTRADQKGVAVPLNAVPEAETGKRCIISGWGKLKASGNLPHILMAADVEVRSDEECSSVFSSGSYEVFSTNLCAGGGERDACQGDSGGPLVCCEESSADVASCRISGVVSWGIGCATKGFPGVYTEVAHYIDWIKETIKEIDGEEGVSRLAYYSGKK